MALTSTPTNNEVKNWSSEFTLEHKQSQPFESVTGPGSSAVITTRFEDLRQSGKTIGLTFINALSGSGVTGDGALEGNEEAQVARTQEIVIGQRRNAIAFGEEAAHFNAIQMPQAAREGVQLWSQEDTRDRIIEALHSKNGVAYGTATETQKDAWLVDNADRVLFGASTSQNSSNDHSASLANIDTTNDKLTYDMVLLAAKIAKTANPKIRPISMGGNGRRGFVMFVHPEGRRQLLQDSAVQSIFANSASVSENNRLIRGGDLLLDNVLVKEIDDLPTLDGVGATSSDVNVAFLCGAQAVGWVMGAPWEPIRETRDYGNVNGFGVRAIDGIEKLSFGSGTNDLDDLKDHGVVTVYHSAGA